MMADHLRKKGMKFYKVIEINDKLTHDKKISTPTYKDLSIRIL
jgi:hypothetical protein